MKRFISIVAMVILCVPFVGDFEAEARGSRGGGFGRSSSGFGRSMGRSGWGGSRGSSYATSRSSSSSSWGRSSWRVNTTTIPSSPNARPSGWTGGNMARRQGTRGTVYSSRSQAETAYRDRLQTRWDREPASRPDHVPSTVNRGGREYDVVFRDGRYGYYGPDNRWTGMTAANMLMTGALLSRSGIYYGTPYYTTRRGSGSMALLVVLLIFGGVVFLGMKRFI